MGQVKEGKKTFLQRVFSIGLVALFASVVVWSTHVSPVRAWPFTHTQAMVLSGFSGPGPTTGVFAATVKSDNSGNVFVLGMTGGTIEVNPASPSTKIGTGAEVSYYLSKFSSTGDHQWTRAWLEVAGAFVDFQDFTFTSSGEIVIVGSSTVGFDLDPNPAVTRTVTSTSPGIILKLTTEGQLSMVREIPATTSAFIQSVAVTGTGDIVVSGGYEGIVDFNAAGGPGGLSFTSTTQTDGFVAMFSSAIVEKWVARVEGVSTEQVEKVHVASDGGVFVALTMSVDVVLKDGAGGTVSLAKVIADLTPDTLVWRLNATGAHQWSMMHDTGASQNDALRTTTQLTDGSLLVLTALNDIVRVSSDGTRVSVTRFNGVVQSMTQVKSGKVIVVGEFANTVDMDPSTGVASFTSATAGVNDVFMSIFSAALSYESTVVIPASGRQYADSVFASPDGGWHISGRSDPITLNLSNTSDAASFSPAAGADSMLFVVGYNAAGTTATPTTTTTTIAPALVLAPARASYVTGSKKVTLTWTAVSGAASYVVTTSSGAVACTSTTTSCVLLGRRNGKVYTYNVRAVNSASIPSVDSRVVKAIPGFRLRTTSYKVKKTPLLTSIVSTPSKGTKTWTVVSGNCRRVGSRLLMPTKSGSCRLRLSVAKKGSYPAMTTTVAVTVTK